ncbi:riboflavin synthase [Chloroflexota bacterium]
MFTGIIEEIGTVISLQGNRLNVGATKVLENAQLGGSMCTNGVCLTLTTFDGKSFIADVMEETLRLTNLGTLRRGSHVNLERPVALGGELGGHLVQGHIDGTGNISAIQQKKNSRLITFRTPEDVAGYLVPKGFVAIDGTSLTITEVRGTEFSVSIVGFTGGHTTLAEKNIGEKVNLEVDIFAKYAADKNAGSRGITLEFLQKHGF